MDELLDKKLDRCYEIFKSLLLLLNLEQMLWQGHMDPAEEFSEEYR